MEIYREYILDLYKNPLNKKIVNDANVSAEGANASCGDSVTIQIKFTGDVISDIGFQGQGCAISIAAASLVTEFVKGKRKDEVNAMTDGAILPLLQISISHTRHKCALLAFRTIKKAIENK